MTQTDDGYNVNKQVQTQSGASKSVSKDVNVEDREIDKTSTTTNKWGQSATREREVEGQGGGTATIEGSTKTSSGREASSDLVAGRNVYGQPAVAGSVNTKYNGNYNVAAGRNASGGWNTAVAGPYGGRVTTTLPSGYRTSTYYGRPYYTYGGAYYRPYMHRGVPYYYPVPVPYHAYYSSPPVGAIIVVVVGATYLMSKDGSYSKKTTSSDGKEVYQSVPPPQGASIKTLPAGRVLVTVSGTTYYLNANAFYRRVMNGAQETFVVVTPPAGVVFVQALPADFEVVQLNTMYFSAKGQVLRALSIRRRQGAVRDGGPPADSTACRKDDDGDRGAHRRSSAKGWCGTDRCTCRTCSGCRGALRRPRGDARRGATCRGRELGDGSRRRSRPGLPGPGSRGRRATGRAARRESLRRRERGG